MLIVNNNVIKMTRGDTVIFDVALENNETFKIGDVIIMSAKRKLKDAEPYAFQIQVEMKEEKEFATIEIEPEFTKDLAYGEYFYDIQVKRILDGSINTIITPDVEDFTGETKSNLYLLKEVTL